MNPIPPPEEIIRYEKDVANRIATITFDRPDQLNAPTIGARRRYGDLIFKASLDDDVKVLVIRGEGDDLGSGADLDELMPKRAGGQALFDLFFRDMDQSLREMGTGDLVVPKRIRRMAENVYGHAAVYRRLLEDDDKAGLAEAIARNVPMEEEAFAAPLAGYLQAVHRALGDVDVDEVLRGGVRWPAPPLR